MAAPSSARLAVLLVLLTAISMAAAQVPPPPAVPSAPPPALSTCNPLKLSVCASVLNGLLGVVFPPGVGNATNDKQCCSLLGGLVEADAAVCLCNAIGANVLGIINVPLGLSLLLNHYDRAVPDGFNCTPA